MIQLYAVTATGDEGPLPDGLERYDEGRLAVLHREVHEPPRAEREAVLDYGAVLRELSRGRAVLPMQFGSTVADTEELRRLVAERADDWCRLLDRLAGHSELIVHLPAPPVPEAAGGSGREYLMARVDAARDVDARRDELARTEGVRAARVLPGRDEERVSLLVADDRADEVAERVQVWASGRGWPARLTGPWPPLSFCDPEEP
jgi:hypothetical protein